MFFKKSCGSQFRVCRLTKQVLFCDTMGTLLTDIPALLSQLPINGRLADDQPLVNHAFLYSGLPATMTDLQNGLILEGSDAAGSRKSVGLLRQR